MSKKELLSKFIFNNNLLSRVISNRHQKNVHILAYHRITHNEPENYMFNSEVFSSTVEDFERQMEYVSKNFNVINFEQLEIDIENDDIKDNSLIITFDDGYYDNYSLAMPILNKYKIGATVFLATDYIDSGDLFWFDVVAGFMKTYSDSIIELDSMGLKFDFSSTPKFKAFKIIGRALKTCKDSTRVDLLSEIYGKFKFEVSDENYQLAKPLSWDNVIEMSSNDIEFGSHTKSHCFLNCIDQDELIEQINGSKLKIENKINKKINSFCYPAGVTNESIKNTVKSTGLYFGVGYRHGINIMSNIDKFDLYREHIELDVNYNLFRANLMLPEIFMRRR